MKLINADDICKIGIETVDEHHQKIVSLINQVYELALTDWERGDLIRIMDEFIAYTEYHFSFEEEYMIENRIIFYQEHKNEHVKLRKSLDFFRVKLINEGSVDVVEFLGFVVKWFRDHVQRIDSCDLAIPKKGAE